jgi:hypothetical protein
MPAASFMLGRLKRLAPGQAVYHGLPLGERLIDDGAQRLCLLEGRTLYLVRITLQKCTSGLM